MLIDAHTCPHALARAYSVTASRRRRRHSRVWHHRELTDLVNNVRDAIEELLVALGHLDRWKALRGPVGTETGGRDKWQRQVAETSGRDRCRDRSHGNVQGLVQGLERRQVTDRYRYRYRDMQAQVKGTISCTGGRGEWERRA